MIFKIFFFSSLYCLSLNASISKQDALKYLDKFGYVNKTKDSLNDEKRSNANIVFRESLMLFQKMHGLTVTGTLNNATIKIIQKPRCGNSDFPSNFVAVSKWNKKKLTYTVLNQNKELKSKTNSIMAQALKYWSSVSQLSFRRAGPKAKHDISIKFGAKNHGDPFPFDGAGGVLAHAFFPQDGRVHFDEDETFTDKSYKGINLKMVAVHEFGHALGLDHTTDLGAVMYPYYRGFDPKFKLGSDDIRGIQFLYGKRKKNNN